MNHPSEWKKIYIPSRGTYAYKHKGTGIIRDSLMKIGKPILGLAKSAASQLVKKSVEKAADAGSKVIVKKAGDKLQSILKGKATVKPAARVPKVSIVDSVAIPVTRPKLTGARPNLNPKFRRMLSFALTN